MKSKFTQHFLTFFALILFHPISLFPQTDQRQDCTDLIVQADITPTCSNSSNGQLELRISGGMPPYRVRWDHGAEGRSLNQIGEGQYRVQVTDALNCEKSATFVVAASKDLQAEVILAHNTKPGKKNGSIEIQMSGGTAPYRFSWVSNAMQAPSGFKENLNTLRSLPAGWYRVVVFDASSCYYEIDLEIE